MPSVVLCRYLSMTLQGEVPHGISRLNIVLALAKLGKQLETYKLARCVVLLREDAFVP